MTVQAQNALLKTIEEPPAYAVLVLITTNPEVFLPTILSRCIQLKLRPLKDSVDKRLPDGENGRFGWSGGYLCGVCERKFRKSDSSRFFGGVCTFVPRGADAA